MAYRARQLRALRARQMQMARMRHMHMRRRRGRRIPPWVYFKKPNDKGDRKIELEEVEESHHGFILRNQMTKEKEKSSWKTCNCGRTWIRTRTEDLQLPNMNDLLDHQTLNDLLET